MPDLLLEVGCEELPSSACREIIDQAPGLVRAALDAAGLNGAGVRVSVAPRRFALRVEGLPAELPPRREPCAARRPPPRSAPTARRRRRRRASPAARGSRWPTWWCARTTAASSSTPSCGARAAPWPTWSPTWPPAWSTGCASPRPCAGATAPGCASRGPVRWIVAKLDEQTVPFELHGLHAGDVSQGHRFLGGPATIGDPASYEWRCTPWASSPTTRRAAPRSSPAWTTAAAGRAAHGATRAASWRRSCSWWSGRASSPAASTPATCGCRRGCS